MAYNNSNPYGIDQTRNMYEIAAGTNPPKYQSFLDSDGNLKQSYAYDPSKSNAFKQMSDIATSSDLSPWAKLQLQSNDLTTVNNRDKSNMQSQGATNQAMQQMMATGGGSSSGAAAFLASQGARNATMANQAISNQAALSALGIQATDAKDKQNLLGQVANTETGALSANAQTAMQDTTAANVFNANRYNQQMAAYGAGQTADAQRSAARSGKK